MNPAPQITLAQYMSAQLFPLTSQPGISPEQQMLLDTTNYDAVREALDNGEQLSPVEQATARELEVKHNARAAVAAELRRMQGLPN